ncbi:hypothetical protein WKI68_19820 [Streptomyces sp. MS1.HAVA.3]|uniref:Uncharacterized protein n=1 Tax=Streptomyces caledonius TaxID=3134107 RepID=A0ABU8U578_9ACTN
MDDVPDLAAPADQPHGVALRGHHAEAGPLQVEVTRAPVAEHDLDVRVRVPALVLPVPLDRRRFKTQALRPLARRQAGRAGVRGGEGTGGRVGGPHGHQQQECADQGRDGSDADGQGRVPPTRRHVRSLGFLG